ncbi:MAG TPA: alkaline phosphatase family protein [Pirellulales bacterium]|nr:alkaline phosphatase family protein [Pirellulales bacterium]
MMRRFARLVPAVLLLLVCPAWCGAAPQRPALVVVVSIDQFPYEYLQRMRANFAADGMFNRFRDAGATMINCHHAHAFTVTAPGHSVLLTGAFPNVNGIIGNDWFDREQGRTVYCVEDPRYPLVGNPLEDAEPSGDAKTAKKPKKGAKSGKAAGVSPRPLLAGTLGDVLKLSDPRSKVFGIALKDRAGVLMAGQLADGVYWFDAKTGNWITSTYYRSELPGYLRTFNESDATEAFVGRKWELLVPSDRYVNYYEQVKLPDIAALNNRFPHAMPDKADSKYYQSITVSPFGSELTLQAARLLISYEKLGQDDSPDILAINLSSNDYVGHAHGPQSLEVQDITIRTDRLLAEFADFVDQQLAGRAWVLALSSDHGVAPVPEYAAALGLPAARNPLGSLTALRDKLEAQLRAEFGSPKGDNRYVLELDENSVYLNHQLAELAGDRLLSAQRTVRDALVQLPPVAMVFTREELLAQDAASKSLARAFERSFFAARSGDVLYALQPYNISGGSLATHGSPWQYDTHVPLLFWGFGIRPGRYSEPVAPAAMAPTLARLLQIEAPSSAAVEAIEEVLAPPPAPATVAPVPQT